MSVERSNSSSAWVRRALPSCGFSGMKVIDLGGVGGSISDLGSKVEEDLVEEGPDEEDAPADEEAGGSSVIDGGRGRIGEEVGERED